MNLWIRLLLYLLASPLRPSIAAPFGTSRLRFRVWPTDLDTNLHMNNGRYLTIMDIGRLDLVVCTGLWRSVVKHRWMPVVSTSAVRFRRELRLFEQFALETRVRYWADSVIVMEHRFRFTKGNRKGAIAATALMKAGFYDRKEKSFVPVQRIMDELELTAESPRATAEITALLAMEETIRDTDRADAELQLDQ